MSVAYHYYDAETLKVSSKSASLNERIFSVPFREALVQQVVENYLYHARAFTKKNKNRSEVSGGGKKPWRQKGTGRARAGSSRSPIWVGGGVTHAADTSFKAKRLNKKMYRGGVMSILAEQNRQEAFWVLEAWPELSKTKEADAWLNPHREHRLLLLLESIDHPLFLATRNLPFVHCALATHVDPVSLFKADRILLSQASLTQLEERLT